MSRAGFAGRAPVTKLVRGTPAPSTSSVPQNTGLEERLKDLLMGRRVVNVELSGDQLTLQLDNGYAFSFKCEGGFKELEGV